MGATHPSSLVASTVLLCLMQQTPPTGPSTCTHFPLWITQALQGLDLLHSPRFLHGFPTSQMYFSLPGAQDTRRTASSLHRHRGPGILGSSVPPPEHGCVLSTFHSSLEPMFPSCCCLAAASMIFKCSRRNVILFWVSVLLVPVLADTVKARVSTYCTWREASVYLAGSLGWLCCLLHSQK